MQYLGHIFCGLSEIIFNWAFCILSCNPSFQQTLPWPTKTVTVPIISVAYRQQEVCQDKKVCTAGQDTRLISEKSTKRVFAVGFITLSDWAEAVESVLRLGLPWRMLRPQQVSSSTDNTLEYRCWLEDWAKEQLSHEVMVGRCWMKPYCGPWSSLWRTLTQKQSDTENPKKKMDEKGNYLLSFYMSWFVLSDLHMLP